jgi:type IX secretion system PorP/SprF family membrane protein
MSLLLVIYTYLIPTKKFLLKLKKIAMLIKNALFPHRMCDNHTKSYDRPKLNRSGVLYLTLFLVLGGQAFAQQEPMYSQYIFNSSVINPAQAGRDNYNQAGILHRNQWVGIPGAPITNSAFVNISLPRNLGYSGSVFVDELGPVRDFSLQNDISYSVQLSKDWFVSGGLRFMLSNVSAYLSELENIDPDEMFNADISTGFYLNSGFGFLFYSQKYFFGFSVPRAINRNLGDNNQFFMNTQRHFFTYGGANYKLSRVMNFFPSILVKHVSDAPIQFDLNPLFEYNEFFSFGPMLRSFESLGMLVGFKMSRNFHLGYIYEYPLTDIRLATRQTHEITLRFLWENNDRKKVLSPRYFF